MKTLTKTKAKAPTALPADYATLCRDVWLPRQIHDKSDHEAALAAIAPLWGREHSMTADQADWFALAADLIADYEDATEKKPKPLPLAKRLAALLDAHAMTAADFGRLLGLEPSMGSKLVNGTRQLTAAHIRTLSAHFALSAEFFL
jgi:antitoxin component HigA of HigAB toxin-antitoxin module